jgi:hypothetical protein
MLELGKSLEPLRDIAGVQGSFVLSKNGEIVARDLPAIFPEGALAEAAPRIQRLWDTLAQLDEAGSDEADEKAQCILRFGQYQVYLREVLGGKLAILAENSVNPPALRMAANLVVRQVNGDIRRARDEQARVASAPPPKKPEPEAEPAPPSRSFVYRGRRYDV